MRLLPEYAAVKKILLALPYAGSDWDSNLEAALTCYKDMVEAFLMHDKGVEVMLMVHPGSQCEQWINKLTLSDEQLQRLSIIGDIEYNDTWVRDYGPMTFMESVSPQQSVSYKSFQFNGWGGKYIATSDNSVSTQLVRYGIDPHIKRPLVLEGGALEINGEGILLVNRDCVVDIARNPNMNEEMVAIALHNELVLEDIEWLSGISLTGDDTDGHIDTLARFISDNRLVCCGRNEKHHDRLALNTLNDQLEGICKARSWELYALPVPVVRSRVDNRLLPATYANFLICNNTLFLPIYGVAEDEEAIRCLRDLLPEKSIIPVRCDALLEQHGSLHCATMQIC